MTDPNYALSSLTAAQSADYWYFGFPGGTGAQDMKYGLYLDLDHQDGSGGGSGALSPLVTTTPGHQPEYAICIRQRAGGFTASDVEIYQWLGSSWDWPQTLDEVGGQVFFNAGFLELALLNTSIGMHEGTGSVRLVRAWRKAGRWAAISPGRAANNAGIASRSAVC